MELLFPNKTVFEVDPFEGQCFFGVFFGNKTTTNVTKDIRGHIILVYWCLNKQKFNHFMRFVTTGQRQNLVREESSGNLTGRDFTNFWKRFLTDNKLPV